jgi:hypothetical protein
LFETMVLAGMTAVYAVSIVVAFVFGRSRKPA